MNNGFAEFKGDYQITTNIENVDLLRILRENVKGGIEKYVFILTENTCLLFLTKKFGKRVNNLDLFELFDIKPESGFGFIDEANGETSLVNGEQVRSTGFTYGRSFMFNDYEDIKDIIDSVEGLEEELELAHEAEKENMGTLKIVGA